MERTKNYCQVLDLNFYFCFNRPVFIEDQIMKSLIFGYGQTGKSFEKYLKNKNISFDIYDDDKSK